MNIRTKEVMSYHIWTVILSLLMFFGRSSSLDNLETEKVTIYGINSKVMLEDGYSWLTKGIDVLESNSKGITVCLFFMLQFQDSDNMLFLEAKPDAHLTVQDDMFSLKMGNSTLRSNSTLRFWEWTHICVFLDRQPAIYVDGTLTTPDILTDDDYLAGTDDVLISIGKMPLNSSALSEPFGGLVTQPQVYLGSLDDSQVTALAYCFISEQEGAIGGEWDYEECKEKMEQCHSADHIKLYLGDSSVKIPNVIYSQDSSEEEIGHHDEGHRVHECPRWPHRETNFHNKGKKGDVGPSCVGERYRSEVCGPRLPYNYFLHRKDTTFDAEEANRYCGKHGGMLVDRSGGVDVISKISPWLGIDATNDCLSFESSCSANSSCQTTVSHCVICQLNWNRTFDLRWNHFDTSIPLQLVSVGPKVYYISRDNLYKIEPDSIIISGQGFLTDFVHIGRMKAHPLSNLNKTSVVILSICSETQFTCDEGDCIFLGDRCNGVRDCPSQEEDDSDETECHILHEPPPSYTKDRTPDINTPLVTIIKLVRVHEVNVEEGLVQIWLKTATKWQDGRLKFTHLNDLARDNIIESADAAKIWVPKYSLKNALFMDDKNYRNEVNLRSTVFIHRLRNGTFDFHGGYEVLEYDGSRDVELEKDDHFLVSYLCDFYLDYFPFDVHECYIHIAISNSGSFISYFDIDKLSVESTETSTSLFYISKLKLCPLVTETRRLTEVKLKFLVSRQYGAFILTTFLPSLILGIIGCVTHSFDQHNFSDRIMVTLTCLIVIASLFSSTNSATPNSASPKLVDVFFFYYIVRLFVIFILHSIHGFALRLQMQRNQKIINQRSKLDPTETILKMKWFPKESLEKLLPPRRPSNNPGDNIKITNLPVKEAWDDQLSPAVEKKSKSTWFSPKYFEKAMVVLTVIVDVLFLCCFIATVIAERHVKFVKFNSGDDCPNSNY